MKKATFKPNDRVRDTIMHRNGSVIANTHDMRPQCDHLPDSVPVVFDMLAGQTMLNGDKDTGIRYVPAALLEHNGE